MEEKEKHTFNAPFHQQQQGWSPVTAAAAVASSSASYRANQVMNQIAVHPLGLANSSSNSRVPPDHHHHHQHPLPPHHNHHDMFAAGSSAAVIHHRPPPESSSFAAAAAANSASSSQFLGFRDLLQGGAPLCFGYGQRIGGSSNNSAGHVLPLPDDLNSMEHKSMLQQMQMMQPLMMGAKMMTAQEMVEAKALAASKSHSEAERRRRERINKHLATLRSLLPNTTKTDKASLLAEVIEHVKELKRLVEDIGHSSPVPSESDEVSVDPLDDEGQQVLIRASLCCDDRPDLLTDLIKTLRTLRLRAVKAEMATLGGRVKNVFVVTSGNSNTAASDSESLQNNADAIGGTSSSNSISENSSSPAVSVSSIQEALKAVLEKHNLAGDLASGSGSKRQRHVGQFGSSSSSDKAPL